MGSSVEQFLEWNKKYLRKLQVSTARGRKMLMDSDPDEARAVFTEALVDPETPEQDKLTFKTLLDRMATPDRPGLAGTLEDFQHGFVSGVAKTPGVIADLGLGVVDLANRALGNPDNAARDIRGRIQEFNTGLGEMFDARGVAGGVGEFTGGIVAGALPYGAAANLTGQAITKVAPASKIGQAIVQATGPGASLGQKVAANVATGVPINAVQAATLDDATLGEKAKTFAIGVGADALFPVVFNPRQSVNALIGGKDKAKAVVVDVLSQTNPQTAQQVKAQGLAAKAEQVQLDQAAKKAERAAEVQKFKLDKMQAELQAKQDWIASNPGSQWGDLSKSERAKIRGDYVASHPDNGWQSKAMRKKAGLTPEGVKPEAVPPVESQPPVAAVSDNNLIAEPKVELAPPPVADPGPVVPEFVSPLRSIKLPAPLEQLVALEGDDAAKAFKALKPGIKYESDESMLDNLKEVVFRRLEGDPTNKDYLADAQYLENFTNALKQAQARAEIPDPASPAGIIETTKLELAQNPPKAVVETVPDMPAAPPPELDPKIARQWFKRPLGEFTDPELESFQAWLEGKVTSLDLVTGKPYMDKMHQVMEHIASKPKTPVTDLQVHQHAGYEAYTHKQISAHSNRRLTRIFDRFLYENGQRIIRFGLSDADMFGKSLPPGLERLESSAAYRRSFRMLDSALRKAHELIDQRLAQLGSSLAVKSQYLGLIADPSVTGANGEVFNVFGAKQRAYIYNPFAFFDQPGLSPTEKADRAWGVILHEVSHNRADPDGSLRFETHLTRNAGDLAETFNLAKHDLRRAFEAMDAEKTQIIALEHLYETEFGHAIRREIDELRQLPSEPADGSRSSNRSYAAPERAGPSADGSQILASARLEPGQGVQGSPGTLATPRPASDGSRTAGGSVRKGGSYIKPGLGGGVAGMAYGVMTTDSEDPNYWAKVAMWTAIGAGGSLVTKGVWNKDPRVSNAKPRVIPGVEDLAKRVRSVDDIAGKQLPMMSRLRAYYTGLVRSTYEVEYAYNKLGIDKLPAQVNGSKLLQTWGRHVGMTEAWLTRGPTIIDPTGRPVPVLDDSGQPIKALNKILVETAQGHQEDLGLLMAARTSLELSAKGRKTPFTPDEALQIVNNAPEFLHKAADEMRQYHKGLLQVLVRSGRISKQAYDVMVQEDWYSPLQRIVGGEKNTIAEAVKSRSVSAPKDIYERRPQGGEYEVANPYDVTVEMTARILRSAEFNAVINTVYDNLHMLGLGVGDLFIRKGNTRTNLMLQKIKAKAGVAAKQLGIGQQDAEGLLSYLDEAVEVMETVDKRHIVSGYADGKLVSYEVAPGFFEAFKSMKPLELDTFLRLASPVAQIASRGVVHNPFFVATQSFIDTFHAALTSSHRFRPVVDSFRGWWNVASNSPEYQALINAGGPSTIQSLRFTGDLEKAVQAVHTAGKNPWETAVHQFKEMHPLEAAKTLMLPWAEAARVGEYLRALDHGESTLEATYAAWNVMGNVKLQGSAKTMRALNMISMFLRPAISGTDEALYKTGLPHPRRGAQLDVAQAGKFLGVGIMSIVAPTALLWWANKDDEQINQLRRTESGARYWWVRTSDNNIIRIRKPQIIGQIFGTTTEQVLDKMFAENPQGTADWLSGMFDDAAPNVLPTIGVVPYALWANKIPGRGGEFISGNVESPLMGQDKASLPARVVSDKMSWFTQQDWTPEVLQRLLSPAGFDMVVRTVGGMLGEDALKAITWAHEWKNQDDPPPASEYPIVGRLFANNQTANLGSIRMFYAMADKIDRKANTVAAYTGQPEKLLGYMPDALPYLGLAPTYAKARAEMNQLWRAIHDLRAMPEELVSPAMKRKLEQTYVQQILMRAWAANLEAEALVR